MNIDNRIDLKRAQNGTIPTLLIYIGINISWEFIGRTVIICIMTKRTSSVKIKGKAELQQLQQLLIPIIFEKALPNFYI